LDIPIHFDNRRYGESKLSFREQLKYIQHLRRLYIHKYGTWSHLAQFLVVGFSGLLVNLVAVALLLRLQMSERRAVAIAIMLSMTWNFALNRRFSFSYARHQSIARQFIGFVAACALGAIVNYATTLALWDALRYKQLAVCVGVLAGSLFNFVASRFVIFRFKHVKS
jgi:dolichol-phosphate mannosyltransferase